MNLLPSSTKRNLFEIENARNLTRSELVATFVPTQAFWRLLSAKHHVILGARGSGKTALAKMLSHDHLSLLADPLAKNAIEQQEFIGVHVPTKLEWVGGLKNKPWQTESEKEFFFQWRLNLSSCVSLLYTIESCISSYCGDPGQQARAERELAMALSESWLTNESITTIEGIRRRLEDIEYLHNLEIARARVIGEIFRPENWPGSKFESDLFIPLRRGITLTTRHLKLKEGCTWLICLDEAEFLEEIHHRILNSHMRAYSGNVFFKLTTLPYCHYTLATNTDVSLDVGHDFEYVYIDSDPVLLAKSSKENNQIGTHFGRTLFFKRVQASGLFMDRNYNNKNFTAETLLGKSDILDAKTTDWSIESKNFELLIKYGSEETVSRAHKLVGNSRFKSEISRKITGVLMLRDAYNQLRGHAVIDVYSGASLAIRCGDANPRRIIRIFNALVLTLTKNHDSLPIPPRIQTRVIRKVSTSALVRVQSEPKCGKELYDFLNSLGMYMHDYFHNRPLTTDQVTSFKINNDVSDRQWQLIQRSVELGLLYPSIGSNARDEMPERQGTFHLAYILSPHFFLMPRRGQARQLSAMVTTMSSSELIVERTDSEIITADKSSSV